jgi:hypothetical protein
MLSGLTNPSVVAANSEVSWLFDIYAQEAETIDYTNANVTEVDPNSELSIASSQITITNQGPADNAYISEDKGVGFYKSKVDYTFDVDVNIDLAPSFGPGSFYSYVSPLMLSNTAGGHVDASSLGVYLYGSGGSIIGFSGCGTFGGQSLLMTAATDYFLRIRIRRNESTYGRIYVDVYTSSADRTAETNAYFTRWGDINQANSNLNFRYVNYYLADFSDPYANALGSFSNFSMPEIEVNVSSKDYTYGGKTYTNRVEAGSFKGIKLSRNKSESGLFPKVDTQFVIENVDDALNLGNFTEGARVDVHFVMKTQAGLEDRIRTVKFKIAQTAFETYKSLKISCEDLLTSIFKKSYPLNELVSTDFNATNDTYIIPEIFGTAYIPLSPFSNGSNEACYILGNKESGETFAISELTTPRSFPGEKVVATNATTFEQDEITQNGNLYQFFQYVIDSTAIAWGGFEGIPMQPIVRFNKSTTQSLTDGPDIVAAILDAYGVSYNSTGFSAASTTLGAYSPALTIQGGLWFRTTVEQVIKEILIHCNSELTYDRDGDVTWKINDTTSVATLGIVNKNSFKTSPVKNKKGNAGYVQYMSPDRPMDQAYEILIPTEMDGAYDEPSNSTLKFKFASGSNESNSCINAKKSATLYFQKLLNRDYTINFSDDASNALLEPADFITLDDLYGGVDVGIDMITLGADGAALISFSCTKYSVIQNWADLDSMTDDTFSSPSVADMLTAVTAGPDASGQNLIRGRLRVGDQATDCLVMDPNEASNYRFWIGNLLPSAAPFAVRMDGYARFGLTTDEHIIVDPVAGTISINGGTSGFQVFVQASAPTTGMSHNDLWFDEDDGYRQYRYNSATPAWEDIQDAEIAVALANAAAAQATADGKIEIYWQDSQPTGANVGDYWMDTDDGNHAYRYNGSTWDDAQDSDIATAIANAATAQSTADGKMTVFYAATEPLTGMSDGDLWVEDGSSNVYVYDTSAWVFFADGTQAAIQNTLSISSGGITMSGTARIAAGKTSAASATAGYWIDSTDFVVGDGVQYLDYNSGSGSLSVVGEIRVVSAGAANLRSDLNVADGADATQTAIQSSVSITSGGLSLNGGGRIQLFDGSSNELLRVGDDTISAATQRGLFLYNTSGTMLAGYYDTGLSIFEGGDIDLLGDNTNPGKITFTSDGETFEFYASWNDSFHIGPATDRSGQLMIGVNPSALYRRFQQVTMYASETMRLQLSDGTGTWMGIYMDSDSYESATWGYPLQVRLKAGSCDFYVYQFSTYTAIRCDTDAIHPQDNNTSDCGTDAYAWQDIYYYVAHDKCSILDTLDDNQVLQESIVPEVVNGETNVDPYGFPKMDLTKMPDYLTNKEKLAQNLSSESGKIITPKMLDDVISGKRKPITFLKKEVVSKQGEKKIEKNISYTLDADEIRKRTFRNFGMFVDLMAGAIKQTDQDVTENIVEGFNAIIEDLIQRVSKLEKEKRSWAKTN